MLNRELLINKYSNLISSNKESFIKELEDIKKGFNFDLLKYKEPLLIYSNSMRNALCYLIMISNSLRQDRILDYSIITGQTLSDQHFLSESQRDNTIFNNVRYADVTFVSISEFTYNNEFLESLIINLVEFRQLLNKQTIIIYEAAKSESSTWKSKLTKLEKYFTSKNFNIVNLISKKSSNTFDRSNIKVRKGKML